MQWNTLEPIVKTVPRVQAALYINKDGLGRIRLTLSETVMKECGNPEKADIQFGVDDGVPKMRLAFGKSGKFEISGLGKGGARIASIPAQEPLQIREFEAEPCEVEQKSKDELIFTLPVEAWSKQLHRPQAPAQRAEDRQPAAPASPAAGPRAASGKYDAVAYLTSKGEKINRIGGGWYMLAGVKVPKSKVLETVNRYRENADLPWLTQDQID